jgi:hypothetical protein
MHFSGFRLEQSFFQIRKESKQELDLVAMGGEHDQSDSKPRDGLLIADALIGGQEDIELALCQSP